LASDGSNIVNVFSTLTRSEQGAVASAFCGLVPLYQDVDARPSSNGHHRIVFRDRWASGLWYEPAEVSDGTILTLALLRLQHQQPPSDLITIEEPERGLHPYLLGELVRLLRKLAEGSLGPKAVQVVLATHSAELLAFARPEEVRFLSR